MKKFLVFSCLLFAFNCISTPSYAWCKKPVQVTYITINNMSDIRQFTFLHPAPKNQLDEYALKIAEPNIKSVLNYDAMVDAIGALKTNDAFCFLYFCCMGRSVIDDLALFDVQADRVAQRGHYALNKYFLNGKVDEKLPIEKFRMEVMRLCAQKMPVCYYCPEMPLELTMEEMKKVSTKKYDDQIISIIEANSDLGPFKKESGRVLYLASRIKEQTMQLPFVEDCFWDGCYEKIAIYPERFRFAVVMIIDGKRVERCYHIHGATIKRGIFPGKTTYDDNRLDYKSVEFCPGAVAEARASCGGEK